MPMAFSACTRTSKLFTFHVGGWLHELLCSSADMKRLLNVFENKQDIAVETTPLEKTQICSEVSPDMQSATLGVQI